jgi:hypothetical protein
MLGALILGQHSSHTPRLKAALSYCAYLADQKIFGKSGHRLTRILNRNDLKFIRPEFGGRRGFLHQLAESQLRYVIVSGAPTIRPTCQNDRLALLIHDDDVNGICELVTSWPIGEPCDVYSSSGLPGFSYGDIPLFTPKLSQRLIANSLSVNGVKILNARDSFFSAIYRSVYLDGFASGIPSKFADDTLARRSDVASFIEAEALKAGILLDLPVTMETLDGLLASNGWRPSIDLLERLACSNSWLARKLESEGCGSGSEPPGLSIFYIRQRAIDLGLTNVIIDTVKAVGFTLITVPRLSSIQLQGIAAEVRGGNWGRGPWPVSGGEPGMVLVCFDPSPISPDKKTLRNFALLDNLRIRTAKQAVRDIVESSVPTNLRFNPMHSTDNAVQAWRAVRSLGQEEEASLRAAVASTQSELGLSHR